MINMIIKDKSFDLIFGGWLRDVGEANENPWGLLVKYTALSKEKLIIDDICLSPLVTDLIVQFNYCRVF